MSEGQFRCSVSAKPSRQQPSRWLYALMWWHGWRAAVHDACREVESQRLNRAWYQYHRVLREYHQNQCEHIRQHLIRSAHQ